MPISLHARMTRSAISPRLATKIRWNIEPRWERGGRIEDREERIGGAPGGWSGFEMVVTILSPPSGPDSEERLIVLDGLAVLDQDFHNGARNLGGDRVEDLHRLHGADDRIGFDPRPDPHEGFGPGLAGRIEGPQHGAAR